MATDRITKQMVYSVLAAALITHAPAVKTGTGTSKPKAAEAAPADKSQPA